MTIFKTAKDKAMPIRELGYGETTLLYCYHIGLQDKDLPELLIHRTEFKETLLRLGLITIDPNEEVSITDKALKVIEQGTHIVVYPLADDKGNVTNYNDTLKTMTPAAAEALVKAILATSFYTKLSHSSKKQLLNALTVSIDYNRNSLHPVAQVDAIRRDREAMELKEAVLINEHFNRLSSFVLTNPIVIGAEQDDMERSIVALIINGKDSSDESDSVNDLNNNDPLRTNDKEDCDDNQVIESIELLLNTGKKIDAYDITHHVKAKIVKQYYDLKAQSGNKKAHY